MIDKDGRFTYSSIVQINHQEASGLIISPNPVKNSLQVSFTPVKEHSTLKLLNASGVVMYTKFLITGTATSDINTTALPAGMYEILLFSDNTFFTKRFIKE